MCDQTGLRHRSAEFVTLSQSLTANRDTDTENCSSALGDHGPPWPPQRGDRGRRKQEGRKDSK